MSTFLLVMAGLVVGLLLAFFVWPTVQQSLLRSMIVKIFTESSPTTPFHLHNGETFFRLLTQAVPVLRNHLRFSTAGAALEEIKRKYRMIGAPVGQETDPAALLSYVKDSGLKPVLDAVGIDISALPLVEFPDTPPALHHGSQPPKGFILPGEQEPLDGMLLSWPINYPARWAFHAQFATHIANADARPLILVPSLAWASIVKAYLAKQASSVNAALLPIATDDVWIRDCGPHFVKRQDGSFAIVATPYAPTEHNFQKHDNASQVEIARAFGLPIHHLPLVIEGGNIISDGAGTMVMFDSVLEHNPERSIADMEQIVQDWFGMERLILFPALKDEVTGHIDMAVKFVDYQAVLVADVSAGHPWKSNLDAIATTLANTRSSRGTPYHVVRMPAAETSRGSGSFWSYVNSLTVNQSVILPFFDREQDNRAVEIYRSLGFSTVVGIDYRDFPLGSVHCQSKEVPKGVVKRWVF